MGRTRIDIPADKLADAFRRAGVSRLWLFGSVVRDDFSARSDVDVLVETERGRGLFVLGELAMDLQDLFGREVHLTTLRAVPPEQRMTCWLVPSSPMPRDEPAPSEAREGKN